MNSDTETDDMLPIVIKWNENKFKHKTMPKENETFYCITEKLPGRDAILGAWNIKIIVENNFHENLTSGGYAKFLFDAAPDAAQLMGVPIKIYDGPKYIATLFFESSPRSLARR